MTINCNGLLIDLSTPKVMGVLNLTPDSFYDGGQYRKSKEVLSQAENMMNEGATFIDIGAYSSRPGAPFVSRDEELRRLLPILEELKKEFKDALISVDTTRSEVAVAALEMGASLINDISGGHQDAKMMEVVGRYNVPYVAMHMRGTPQTMQLHTDYDNLTKEVIHYGSEVLAKSAEAKINDLVFDPGFGFAKTLDQNYQLLGELELLQMLECPILVGISRKSMIYKTLNITPNEALNGTTALHMIALQKGANILRVHDVKEAMECIHLIQKFPELRYPY